LPAVPNASHRVDEAVDLRLTGAAAGCVMHYERLISAKQALQLE